MDTAASPALERRASRKGKERETDPGGTRERARHASTRAGMRPDKGAAEQVEGFKKQLGELLRARNAEKEAHATRTAALEQTVQETQHALRSAQSSLTKRDAEIISLREEVLRRAAPAPRPAPANDAALAEIERELRRLRADAVRHDKERLAWELERVELGDAARGERRRAAQAGDEVRAAKAGRERAAERAAAHERELSAAVVEAKDARTFLRAAAARCGALEESKAPILRAHRFAQVQAAEREGDLRAEVARLRTERDEARLDARHWRDRHEDLRCMTAETERDLVEQVVAAVADTRDLEEQLHANWRATHADLAVGDAYMDGIRQNLQDATTEADAQREQLNVERTITTAHSTDLHDQLDLARAEHATLSANLATAQATTSDLSADLVRTRTQLAALQANYAELTLAHATQTEHLAAVEEELAAVRAEMTRERTRWEERKEVVKRLGGDLGMLGTGYGALEEECEALRAALVEHQATQSALDALRLDHRILQDKLAQYQYEAHALGDLNASLSGVQPALGDRVAYIQGLRVELSETKEALITSRAHLASSRTKIAALGKELDIYRSQEIPLHVKPVAKRITVARVRDPLGSSLGGNIAGRQ